MARQVGKFFTALCCAMVIFSQLFSAEGLSLQERDALLKKHNDLRAGVPVPNLTWDANAARSAQRWADGCLWSHTSNSFGQNLYKSMSTASFAVQPSHLAGGVQAWYDEVQWYTYSTNKCNAPAGYSCGHYTQVVWRKTTGLGCGYARCENSASMNPLKKWKTLFYLVCFYSPPGNYIGQSPYLRADVEESSETTDVEVDSKIFEADAEESSQITSDELDVRTNAEQFSVITSDELDSRAGSISKCDASAYVAIHNQLRQSVKPGMKLMTWNSTIADYAQTWSNACIFKRNFTNGVGQNMYAFSGSYASPSDVVGTWFNEKNYYDYNTYTCQPGKVCVHYTQVVWEDSVQLGCGCSYCRSGNLKYIVVCDYSPPGNRPEMTPYQ